MEELIQRIEALAGIENNGTIAPVEQFGLLAEAGLLKIVLPGNELDFNVANTPQLLQLLKAIGRADLSIGRIYEGHINALFLIHLYATKEQKERWFADAADGCLFSVWNTQAENGIEIKKKEDNSFVLSGKKTFASGASIVKRALVTGNTNEDGVNGWQMCIVNANELPSHHIDTSSWKPLGMKSSISYTFDFTGYTENANDLFGKGNDYYQQPYFSGGAIRFAAVQLGGAEALFNHTVAYLKSLHRINDTFQSMRLAQMTIALTTGNQWLQQAATNWDKWHRDEKQCNRLIAYANMTRTAIEDICLQVVELASKCIGARGLQQPFVMERMVRDLQFYLRQPAPDAALIDVAKYATQSGMNIERMWHEREGIDE